MPDESSPVRETTITPHPRAIDQPEERMLAWFRYEHLPPHLQPVASLFADVAQELTRRVLTSPERTVALRKLLEAKDAAVRAVVLPGH